LRPFVHGLSRQMWENYEAGWNYPLTFTGELLFLVK
jgi:hypothetical protein